MERLPPYEGAVCGFGHVQNRNEITNIALSSHSGLHTSSPTLKPLCGPVILSYELGHRAMHVMDEPELLSLTEGWTHDGVLQCLIESIREIVFFVVFN